MSTHSLDDDGPSVRGRVFTIKELIDITGYTEQAIRGWMALGLPVHYKGSVGEDVRSNPTTISLNTLIRWKEKRARSERPSYAGGVEDSKARLQSAQAEKRELELELMRGEVFKFADIEPYIEDNLVALRTNLLGIEEDIREDYGEECAKAVRSMIVKALNRYVEEMPDLEGIVEQQAA